jgi:hypothetical protein
MPIERRSTARQTTTVAFGVLTVVLAVVLGYAVVHAATKGGAVSNIGEQTVHYSAEALANDARDAPILLSDISGNGQHRPVVVTHHGSDAKVGWVVFDARPPGAPADCILTVDRTTKRLVFAPADRARCGDRTYPDTGVGFTTYPWTVDAGGNLVIDFKRGGKGLGTTSTTTVAATTSTTP